ncbi:MAG: hypothetical protein J6Z46_11010, partial [Lachnospiraceae bacterium]|nr:hypothetical protein [Lachnospiraceae bacterium]
MARILNLLIVILESVALAKGRKKETQDKSFVRYGFIAQLLTLISSLLLVIFGQKAFVEVLRLVSVSMLVISCSVTLLILAPMSGKAKETIFSHGGFLKNLLIPVLSVLSYRFAEDKAPFLWILVPVVLTAIYGCTMLLLNAAGKIDGPYPFFRIKKIGTKAAALWMVVLMTLVSVLSGFTGYKKAPVTDVKYIFVHGLSGWGSYDLQNEFFPYWGLSGGSVIRYLNDHGYESYAASVDPTGSAWDRACELYAQLTGTRVDYGEAHSRAAGHDRFGRDFSGNALMEDFETSKVALIGQSFGGATIRLFSEVLKNGSEEERAATKEEELSPFFKGGNGDNLLAVVTLAAPTNGTTAYDMYEDPGFDPSAVK